MGGDESYISHEEAIGHATDFCHRIGAPVESGKVTASPLQETGRTSHYLPRLKVNFAEQAEIEVAARVPLICAYDNLALRKSLRRQPVAPPISEAEAIRIAAPIIQATGQAGDLVFDGVDLIDGDIPLYASRFSWIVWWKRAFRGTPYHDQHASVRLQASSGALRDVSVVFRSPPPVDAVFQITSQQAEETARAMLSNWATMNEVDPSLWSQEARRELLAHGVNSLAAHLKIEVVQPNRFWPSGDPKLAFALAPLPISRVAWVCQIDCVEKSFTFWIDVETGDVVGGDSSSGPIGST